VLLGTHRQRHHFLSRTFLLVEPMACCIALTKDDHHIAGPAHFAAERWLMTRTSLTNDGTGFKISH